MSVRSQWKPLGCHVSREAAKPVSEGWRRLARVSGGEARPGCHLWRHLGDRCDGVVDWGVDEAVLIGEEGDTCTHLIGEYGGDWAAIMTKLGD